MRRLIYAMVALAIIGMAAGCNKDKEPAGDKGDKSDMRIVGSWYSAVEEFDAEVYTTFAEDGIFDLYQRLGEGRYRHYEGTWQLTGTTLTGSYSDDTTWGDSYTVAYADDDTMTLTATASAEVMTYLRRDIPAEIIEDSVASRADINDEQPIL